MAEPFRTLHLIAFGLVDGERTVVAGSADGGPGEPIPVSRIEAVIDVIERKRVVDLWTWLGSTAARCHPGEHCPIATDLNRRGLQSSSAASACTRARVVEW